MTQTTGKIPFTVEISRMIALLAEQIYPSPFALLRENIQNSFDAILLRQHLGHQFEPRIEVTIEPTHVRVADNGVGMSRSELRDHFWKAGSSSKNTSDARAAGVVGTFGIGAMANFGVAEELVVTSESVLNGERTRCLAQRSTLSVTEDCIYFEEQTSMGQSGTEVIARMQADKFFDVAEAVSYVASFVAYLPIPVSVNGTVISGQAIEDSVPNLIETWSWREEGAEVGPGLKANVRLVGGITGEVRIDLWDIELDGQPVKGRLVLRQGWGSLRTFRSHFGLATAGVSSIYGFGGVADFLFLQPTAGREALTTESLQALQRIVTPIDDYVSLHLAERPESNVNACFVHWVASRGRWDLGGNLLIRVEPGEPKTLHQVCELSRQTPLLLYAGNDQSIIAHASEERPLLVVSRGSPRRNVELNYLRGRCQIEELTDEPKVLESKPETEYSLAEEGLAYWLSSILSTDYFLSVEFRFGKISHGLPILVIRREPKVEIFLDPEGNTTKMMLDIYNREYIAFGHMAKDFVRNVIFPHVSDLVSSATRQGAEAFLKSIQRNREVVEYQASDREELSSLWTDYLEGKITKTQAAARSAAAVARSYQVIDSRESAPVSHVVPDVIQNEFATRDAEYQPSYDAEPSIQRLDIETDCKLLTIAENEEPLKGYRCFLTLADRLREENGHFFLQPHRTSIVWGGQKALFIFEHQSGSFGLYYDLQTQGIIAEQSGGGAYPTCTIVMKNRIFIPVPEPIRLHFLPKIDEKKRFIVRGDILYINRK